MEKDKCNIEIGRKGEELACTFLESNGFEILYRNYRYQRVGEIDIIAQKSDLIVFVEVKSRNYPSYGGALYSISNRKKATFKKIASQFLASHTNLYSKDNIYRFDMISIVDGKIEWIEDMFR